MVIISNVITYYGYYFKCNFYQVRLQKRVETYYGYHFKCNFYQVRFEKRVEAY